MALVNHSFTALINTDPDGDNTIAAQAVTVKNELDASFASIFSDSAGTSPIVQPGAVTDSNGVLEFFVAPGIYLIQSGTRTETVIIDNDSRLKPDNVLDMQNSKHIRVGDKLKVKGRISGDNGGGDWDAITKGSTVGVDLPDAIKILVGLADSSMAFILNAENTMDSAAYGMLTGVDAKDVLAVAVNDPNVSELIITQDSPKSGRVTMTRGDIKIKSINKIERIVANPILIADRAIFMADGFNNIEIDAEFDLMGEGTRQIGVANLEENVYTTTAGRDGISGPANSAVFFLRCSNIKIRGSADNTGESGYVLRNCGSLDIDVSVENVCGSGVEISTPAFGSDGSSAPLPVRGNWNVKCNGKHVNDLKMGAGNAIVVSVAGSESNEVFRNVNIDVVGEKNAREIHNEFNSGSTIELFDYKISSRGALQGAVVLQGRNGRVSGEVINGGTAGAGAINTGYPSMYAYLGSTGAGDVDVDINVDSTNDDGFILGTDGAITADTAVFTSATSNFPTSIVGKYFAVEGANPSGSPLEAFVLSRDSATQLTLDLDAQVTVSGATFGFGSGLRNPLSHAGNGPVDFDGSKVKGGVFSGLPAETEAAALKFITGGADMPSSGSNMKIVPPGLIGSATAPIGYEIGAGFGAPITERDNNISGFTEDYVGFAGNSTATRCPIARKIVQDAFPDTAADTFGTALVFIPRTQAFDYFFTMSIEFDFSGAPVGTLEAQVEAFFVDGGTNTVSLFGTADSTLELTTGQLATLHRDNQKIIKLEFKVKNSSAGRQADKGRLNYLGIES